MNSFSEGVTVKYKCHVGKVKFICNEYLTICIHANSNPLRDVCIVVYASDWNDVQLLSGNRNSEV